MNIKSNIERSKALPFFLLSPFTLSQFFQTGKSKVLENLKNNNFSKSMIKHVNGFSKIISHVIIMKMKVYINYLQNTCLTA